MRDRPWPLIALLASAVLVVVSLSLPWEVASCGTGPASPLACLFTNVDGWSAPGDLAALAAVLLAALAAWAFLRPAQERVRLLDETAFAVTWLVVAVAAETHARGHQLAAQLARVDRVGGVRFHVGSGLYVGVAGAILAMLGVALRRLGEPRRVRLSARACIMVVLALGVLVALLLPWERSDFDPRVGELGVAIPSGGIAAVFAVWSISAWLRSGRASSALRLPVAATTLLFAGAAVPVGFGTDHAYGAWIGLAFAALLVLGSATDAPSVRRVRLTHASVAAGVVGAVFVASLFLPWQTECFAHGSDLDAAGVSGRCVWSNGFGLTGSTAALLAIVLTCLIVLPGVRDLSKREVGTAFALLVATLGFQSATGFGSETRFGLGYGSFVGLAAAAILVAIALAPAARPCSVGITAVGSGAVGAIVLAIAYVTAMVVPWWGLLPNDLWAKFAARPAESWLTIASVLLGLRLAFLWLRQAEGRFDHALDLVAVSVVLVVLTILETLPLPSVQPSWTTAVLVGLASALALLAAVGARGGVRNVQVPEILRIDRI